MSDEDSVRTQTATKEIEALRRRLDAWRGQKRWRGEAMPAELWRRAGRLAARHGVYRVSAALNLDYDRLREAASGAEAAADRSPQNVDFVELTGRWPRDPGITIAVERADAKLEIELHGGGSGVDVLAVLSRFLGDGA